MSEAQVDTCWFLISRQTSSCYRIIHISNTNQLKCEDDESLHLSVSARVFALNNAGHVKLDNSTPLSKHSRPDIRKYSIMKFYGVIVPIRINELRNYTPPQINKWLRSVSKYLRTFWFKMFFAMVHKMIYRFIKEAQSFQIQQILTPRVCNLFEVRPEHLHNCHSIGDLKPNWPIEYITN